MDKKYTKWIIALGVLLVGVLWVKLILIGTQPWDWDEPVYSDIAQGVNHFGFPSLTLGNETQGEWYVYHPPQHFYLLSAWQGLFAQPNVMTGRAFSLVINLVIVALAMVLTHQVWKHVPTTLLVGALLSIDGWFSYTSTLIKLDGTALVIAMLGMVILTHKQNWTLKTALFGGLFIGLAAIHKHVAALFVLMIAFHWVIIAWKDHKSHFVALAAAGTVVMIYILAMIILVGDPYVRASEVQVLRSLGQQEARGLDYGPIQALEALLKTYWAFGGSIAILVFAGLIAIKRVTNHVLGRQLMTKNESLIMAWLLSGFTMLLAIRLRNPHYLVYVLPPAVMLVGHSLLKPRLSRRVVWSGQSYLFRPERWAVRLLTLIVVLHLLSFGIRLTSFSAVDALREIDGVMEQLPANSVILSEEPVCALSELPCYKIGDYQTEGRLRDIRPTVVITYSSTTQTPPQSPAIVKLISESQVIYSIQDWKSQISVRVVSDNYDWE